MSNSTPPQNTVALQIRDVVKSYASRKALAGITLQVEAGQFVALLGPNGAGKTTLFQLLSGLFVADSGYIEVLGCNIQQRPTVALAGIGVVFQQATLDLDLSVLANLKFHARLHGMPARLSQQRIEQELTRLELYERRHDSVRALSGGNRRKIELARALLHDPAVLLMDEATVGLDPASRHQLLEYVQSLCQERGVGVLWATHLVDEADKAQRVVVLHHGHILYQGIPSELIQQRGTDSLAAAFLEMTSADRTHASPSTKGEAV